MIKTKTFTPLLLSLLLLSCGSDNENIKAENKDTSSLENKVLKPEIITDSLIGEYRGDFGPATIIFSLSYINLDNGSASGYNIVRGNRRNIKGKVEEKEGVLYLKLSEPGDDKYDGVFDITLNPDTREIEGTWTPNDEKKAPSRTLHLKKMMKLSPDDVIEGDWFITHENMNSNGEAEDYSHGIINFKKDGTCHIEINHWVNKNENSLKENLKGSWLKNDKKLTLEIEKSKILKKQKFNLNYVDDSDMGYGYYTGDNLSVNKWMY